MPTILFVGKLIKASFEILKGVDDLHVHCLCLLANDCFVSIVQPPEDALFTHPRLFRACVPPGMHRFRGNIWDYDSRPQVMRTLGYPLATTDRIRDITEARNIELGLGLQV